MNLSTLVLDEGSRRELKDVMTKILREVAPGEIPMFVSLREFSSHSVPATSESSSAVSHTRTGFPGLAEAGVISLHLVTGTLALIEFYLRKKERLEQREFEDKIRQEWQKALVQAGMSAELAQQIPVKFSPEMIRFITTLRLREQQEMPEKER